MDPEIALAAGAPAEHGGYGGSGLRVAAGAPGTTHRPHRVFRVRSGRPARGWLPGRFVADLGVVTNPAGGHRSDTALRDTSTSAATVRARP